MPAPNSGSWASLFWPQGLAMTNMGDIDRQAIAGAVSTGTHGTGATGLGSHLEPGHRL